jgi:flagellar basal-body rod modification protein FlgD
MIDATGFTGSVPLTSDSQTSRTDLGRAEFMTLLLTQLQNQDPMNPLEAHEFAAQLADFTSVDELGQINDALAYQLQSLQLSAALNETSFSAALVGKSVIAEGSQFRVADHENVEVTVDIGDAGGEGKLRVYDESGAEVVTRDLGHLAGGRQTLEIPDDLGTGTYRYELEVTDGNGDAVPVTRYVAGTVDRVLFHGGQITLSVGGIEIGLGALIEITSDRSNQG